MYCIIHNFLVAGSTRSDTQHGAFRSVFTFEMETNPLCFALFSRLDLLCFAFRGMNKWKKKRVSARLRLFCSNHGKRRFDLTWLLLRSTWAQSESSLRFCTCSTLLFPVYACIWGINISVFPWKGTRRVFWNSAFFLFYSLCTLFLFSVYYLPLPYSLPWCWPFPLFSRVPLIVYAFEDMAWRLEWRGDLAFLTIFFWFD